LFVIAAGEWRLISKEYDFELIEDENGYLVPGCGVGRRKINQGSGLFRLQV
jgi:hypothetical protein